MKTFLRISFLIAAIFTVAATTSVAQRIIKGIVYMDGELAAGITVEAHKGSSMMTSFDGVYEVEVTAKSKYIEFTFIDDDKKLVLEGLSGDTHDFAFTGELPSGDGAAASSAGVNLKTAADLMDDNDFKTEFSLYTEFYKQKNYTAAKPHWENLYNGYPKSTTNLYIQGAKMFESFIINSKTDADRDKNIDRLMKIYDQRIKYFGQEGYLLGRKGTSFLKYKLDPARKAALEGEELKEAYKIGYEYLNKSAAAQGDKTEIPVLVVLMQTTRALFKLGELPKETVVSNYDKCNKLINNAKAANTDASFVEKAEVAQAYIEEIFGKSGAADCEALLSIFTPQFEENNDDAEFIKNILRRLRRAKCDDSELYEKGTERLYELDPSAEAAFNMARRYLKLDDMEKAKGYYKQAMEQETDQDLLATYYYEYGVFVYAKERAYSEARTYARKAISIKPDYCEANMLIGDIYVAASNKYSGDAFEKAAIFWLASDYYSKARRGEDCSLDAAGKIANYKKYFPKKEEGFMRDVKDGAPFKIEGWINETTKARL
jgi:tetratricopeptide (TPR) repeat protein